MKKTAVLISIVAAFLSGCAGKSIKNQQEIIEKSASEKPGWITKLPKDDENLYFRGIRTYALKLEDGYTDSRMDAVKQMVEFLGQKGITTYESLRTEKDTTVKDRIKMEGVGVIKGGDHGAILIDGLLHQISIAVNLPGAVNPESGIGTAGVTAFGVDIGA